MEPAYWSLGWHAWVDGKSFLDCPFPSGDARSSWMKGYDDARSVLTKQ